MKYIVHLISIFHLIFYLIYSYLNDLKFLFKTKYRNKKIFIAGMPMSATTYIKNMVGLIPDYKSRLMPMPFQVRNDQDISNSAFIFTPSWSYSIFKTHLRPKETNLEILKKNNINKIIVSYRDPRDVAISRYHRLIKFPKKKHESHSEIDYNNVSKNKAINHSIRVVCKDLIPWVHGWLNISKSKKFNIHFCKYEDLISNPKEEFKKILNFYEITLSENIIDNIILKTKGKSNMVTNIIKGRFQPMALSSNFRRGGIGYWKTEFSQENLELFNSLSGDVLEKLNYEK